MRTPLLPSERRLLLVAALSYREPDAGVTVLTGSNAGQGVCQVNINVQVNIVIAPITVAPALIIEPLPGSLVTAIPFLSSASFQSSGRPLHCRAAQVIFLLSRRPVTHNVEFQDPVSPNIPFISAGFGVPATCQTQCSFTNNGAAQGEPHFTGFDGSLFDFQGEPTSCFFLLKSQHSTSCNRLWELLPSFTAALAGHMLVTLSSCTLQKMSNLKYISCDAF